jgi:nicotinamide-nucleotide amidase
MNVQILTVGDELLIGQVIDSNSAWMAKQLNLIGAQVTGIQTTGDDLGEMIEALQRAAKKADVVLITGGLGPTRDDVTKKALAQYFDTGFVFSQETFAYIERFFSRLGRTATDAHRQQCFMPQNASLLPNKMGTAPGMWFDEDDVVYVSMPGVPYEMQYLMQKEVLPRLQDRFPGTPILHKTIRTVGEGESNIAKRLETFEAELPNNVKLAYLPSLGQVRLRLTARGGSRDQLEHTLERYAQELEKLVDDLVFGFDDQTLEEVVGETLRAKKLTVGTAESCTGGFLAHRITSIPGSSDYFLGSIIAYANEVKQELLGVKEETLQEYGAVSEATVREMVAGTLKLLGTDLAIATSGIAGPGGGTPEKPVGTVWLAIGNQHEIRTHRLQLGKDRLKNIEYSTVFALNMIRQAALELFE